MAYRSEYYGRRRGQERPGEDWESRDPGEMEHDRWRPARGTGSRWSGRHEGWGSDPSYGRYPYGELYGPGEPTYGRGYTERPRYYGADPRPEPYEYEQEEYGPGRQGRSSYPQRGYYGQGYTQGQSGQYGQYGEESGYRGEQGRWGLRGQGREHAQDYGSGYESGYAGRSHTRESRASSYYGRGPKGYRRSDERIREDVSDRLMWDPDVDASGIEVSASEGVVTLRGVVEDRAQKRAAEDIAEEVLGVEDVNNELKVRRGFLAGLTGEKADESDEKRAAMASTQKSAGTTSGSQTAGAPRT